MVANGMIGYMHFIFRLVAGKGKWNGHFRDENQHLWLCVFLYVLYFSDFKYNILLNAIKVFNLQFVKV